MSDLIGERMEKDCLGTKEVEREEKEKT